MDACPQADEQTSKRAKATPAPSPDGPADLEEEDALDLQAAIAMSLAAPPEPAEEEHALDMVDISVKWGKEMISVSLPGAHSLADLKLRLQEVTGVLIARQKVLGLKAGGRPASDDVRLCDIKFPKKVMMIGAPEASIIKEPPPSEMPDVFNDLDIEYSNDSPTMTANDRDPRKDPASHKALQKRLDGVEMTLINKPRAGKKLLVFDLDYTLFDCGKESRRVVSNLMLLKRPHTDELLGACYEKYEIVIWSATHWKWVEAKLTELGMLTHPHYKIMAVLDRSSMFKVNGRRHGRDTTHEVKPLDFIYKKMSEQMGGGWGTESGDKCGEFSAANTVHIDDLSRNFAMNPQSGLKVTQFKDAPNTREHDTELIKLKDYLLGISDAEDFSALNHKHWRR